MPAPRSARPPASSVTMPPAVSRPWLVTLRSTMKSTIPTRIRIIPIAGGITNIGTVPSGRSTDIQMTVASSLEGDCTAHHGDDSQRGAEGLTLLHPALVSTSAFQLCEELLGFVLLCGKQGSASFATEPGCVLWSRWQVLAD